MADYQTLSPASNIFPVLSYPAPVWTLDQRRPRLRKRRGVATKGRGVRRRDAVEFGIGDVLTWLAALVHGDQGATTRRGKPLPVARGLYERLGHCTAGQWDLRGKIRARVSWLVTNGPASGWALPNEALPASETIPLTPYYVPLRSRSAAEAWVRFARRTYQLVALFRALLEKVRPAQRTQLQENSTARKAVPVLLLRGESSTGSRSHVEPPGGPAPPGKGLCPCNACAEAERKLRRMAEPADPMPAIEAIAARAKARAAAPREAP